MPTYKFKTDEQGIDAETRTIIKIVPIAAIPATESESSFTLEQKDTELVAAEEALITAQKRVDELKAEIAEVVQILKIKRESRKDIKGTT